MKVKVVELGNIITGNTPSKKTQEFYDSNDIGFIKPDTISDTEITLIKDTNEYISERARTKSRVVQPGAVFVTCIGTIGKIGISCEHEFAFNQQINAIIPNDKVISKYLAYNLFSQKHRLADIANAPVVPIINKTQFSEFTIDIDEDIEKQKKVVETLDNVCHIINARKQELQKLDELIKARFVEMFGDPVVNSKRWETKTIDEICSSIYGGGTPSKSHPEYWEGNIPWVSSKDMKDDYIFDSIDHINEIGVANSSAKMVPANSVIMVIRSGILKHTLPVAVNKVPITVNQDLKALIPKKDTNPIFLSKLIKFLEADILTGVRAVTADNIEFNSFKQRQVIVPPIELQNQFADFVQQVDKSKVVVQEALDKAQLLFDSLMQEYFG